MERVNDGLRKMPLFTFKIALTIGEEIKTFKNIPFSYVVLNFRLCLENVAKGREFWPLYQKG